MCYEPVNTISRIMSEKVCFVPVLPDIFSYNVSTLSSVGIPEPWGRGVTQVSSS